ncbi:MAG: putative ABC exporter domain-containing protein [Gemmatimonadales bacterium]
MIGALAYLTARSVLNRLAYRAGQLRRPRYLVALALGVAYVWGVLGAERPGPLPDAAVDPRSAELLGAVMLMGIAAWGWTFGSERRALGFSPAEVTFLFPAPLTRRALIHYKLARLQLVILLNALIWTLLLSRQTEVSGWRRATALWALLSTIALHRTGAALVRRSVAEHGVIAVRRRALSLALLALALAGAVSGLIAALPALAILGSAGAAALVNAVEAAAAAPVAGMLLRPFRLVVAPLAADDAAAWTAAMGPALIVLALHYVWVLRSDAAFEEAAAAWSLERARRGPDRGLPLPRGAASPTLLPLAPTGRGGTALVWKNLAAVFRRGRVRNVALGYAALATVTGAASLAGVRGLAQGTGALALTWAGFALLLGPQWVRNDLRRDLRQLDLLRSYPLRGRTVVAAEAAAAAVSLTLIQYGLLTIAWLAFLGERGGDSTLPERTALLAGAVLVLPLVNYVALLLQNGAALLYPAWMLAIGDGTGGLEALGQNLLATVGFALVLAVLLVPPTGVGLMLAYAAGGGAVAVGLGAAAALAVLALEAVGLASVLGSVYDATDASTPGIRW